MNQISVGLVDIREAWFLSYACIFFGAIERLDFIYGSSFHVLLIASGRE